MIYDPITRQQVELIGRYPEQDYCFKFGGKQKGQFRFVRVRYKDYIRPEFKGGFAINTERDVDVNNLVADDGSREIHKVYESLPLLPAGNVGHPPGNVETGSCQSSS